VTSSETTTKSAPPAEISQVVEHLFRHESGKMVASLTRIFGLEHLTLAEDVVQEALARALRTWPFHGVPENPSAWLMRAARNLALDVVRREKVFRDKQAQIIGLMDRPNLAPEAALFPENEIADDRLRMIFACCHPLIPPEAQVALALNTLCGFSVAEISRAFLSTEDICLEAIRLANLLAAHPIGNQPKTHALLALMLLNTARNATRVDDEGNLLRLQEQDRRRWDQPMIARGMFHFAHSAAGEDLSRYHLQAGIAACHCAAKHYDSTDWRQILALYDHLVALDDSPIVGLNRAVAVANVRGPAAGIAAVETIRNRAQLDSYYLLYAVLGEFEARQANFSAAAAYFRQALELTPVKSEQLFLSKRIETCVERRPGSSFSGDAYTPAASRF
jgi:predicted RNA polymerase sigma factor